MKLTVDANSLRVESARFTARFDGAALASFIDKETNTEFCRQTDGSNHPLEMYYVHNETLGHDKHETVEIKLLSDIAARIIVAGNDSDRELFVRLDPVAGDLCVTPSGQSARRGVISMRWNIPFAAEAALVLPCVNGIYVEKHRDFPRNDRFAWPYRWNAQLAVAERNGRSMMVHSEDTAFKFKALNLTRGDGLSTLGFESEQTGPVWSNRNAGGVEWRLNTYDGDWRKPARRYQHWMFRTYSLDVKQAARPDWVNNIEFSIGWAPSSTGMLDSLAKVYDPAKTLIHLSNWRTSKYDVDYPDYKPADEAREFMKKANATGFRVMPHFNYFSVYNRHPLFPKFADWQIRSVERNQPQGWYWPPDTHDYTRMAYIHPGLGAWRRTLIDTVRQACAELNAPAAFIDQTLCTWNTDNGVVENMTTVEGLHRMQQEFLGIQPDMVIAGEGLNEISFQHECFGQAHIHDGWGDLGTHHIDAAHSICSFLWGRHARYVGYYHLGPEEKDTDIGIEVYKRMGAIPTFIPRSFAKEHDKIHKEHPVIAELVKIAVELAAEAAL